MAKPRISLSDQRAYDRVAAMPVGAAVVFNGAPANFTGMAGYLITLKVKRRTVYLRAGDPRIKALL